MQDQIAVQTQPPRTGPRAAHRFSAWERSLDRLVLLLGRTPWGRSGNGQAHGLMRVFQVVERILARGHRSHTLQPGGIILYEIMPLPADRPLPLLGERPVQPGELVIALHFDNRFITALGGAHPERRRITWQMMRAGAAELQLLADRARAGVFPPGVRAAWGETLLYTALPRLGFSTRPARRVFRTPWARLYMLSIVAIYGRPDAGTREYALERFGLGEAWIGLRTLRQRFPDRDGVP